MESMRIAGVGGTRVHGLHRESELLHPSGKPELIAGWGDSGTINDVKTAKPSPSHGAQGMVYIYVVPRALGQFCGVSYHGRVAYGDHQVDITALAVDETFIKNLSGLVLWMSVPEPA